MQVKQEGLTADLLTNAAAHIERAECILVLCVTGLILQGWYCVLSSKLTLFES